MTKIDDAGALRAALPQRQLAEHASRQWQAALEHEWLRAWSTPSPLVPDSRSGGSPVPTAPLMAPLPDAGSSRCGAAVGQALATPTVVSARLAAHAPAAQALARVGSIGAKVAAELSTSSPGREYPVNSQSESEGAKLTFMVGKRLNPVSQQPSDSMARAQAVTPFLAAIGPAGLADPNGCSPVRHDFDGPSESASAPRAASAGLVRPAKWGGALRLSSPEAGKVQAALRDSKLNPDGAHRVAMNLSGALSNMGFDTIRIYVNGKRYAVGKQGTGPIRPAPHANAFATPTDVSDIKE